MKGVGFGLGVVLFVNSFAALADDSQQSRYATAFGLGTGGGLSIKKMWDDTNQVFAGFNLSYFNSQNQNTSSGFTTSSDSNSHGYTLFAGTRHFLEKGSLSKFIQISLSGGYGTSTTGNGFSSTSKGVSLIPGYGIEYFLTPDISIEGVMGLSYTYSKTETASSVSNIPAQSSSTTKSFSFPTVGMAITYYW